MVERIEFYADAREKNTLLTEARALGETMIHDDHVDQQGNRTDGSSGRLTFDTRVPKPDTPEETTHRELLGKLSDDTITNAEIRDLLRFEFLDV